MSALAWAAAGAASWTLLEYLIHMRFGHLGRGRDPFGAEHIKHHASTAYFAPAWKKAAAAASIVTGLALLLAPLLGPRAALVYAAGLTAMYVLYELVHRRAHTHAPRGAYSRFLRRNHFFHHFHDPRSNYGVTSPFWDLAFGTYKAPGVIKVPDKQAMDWLIAPDGKVKDAYARHYVLTGPRSRAPGSAAERAPRSSP